MLKTQLHQNHIDLKAKMVEFAGYEMPIQYDSINEEAKATREQAGLFDVSHMGQFLLTGKDATKAISYFTPTDFSKTELLQASYTVLLNKDGGIVDDLIATKLTNEQYFIVLNASRKVVDVEQIKDLTIDMDVEIKELSDRSLLAVQGPKAEEIVSDLISDGSLKEQKYMTLNSINSKLFGDLFVSRLGYTGEDGYEISVNNDNANRLFEKLVETGVKPAGLAARDILRLEMGYPLYGNDLNEQISPVEATISWVITKGHDSFLASDKIAEKKTDKSLLRRRSFMIEGKGIARAGFDVFKDSEGKEKISTTTSGGFSPILGKSVGQVFLPQEYKAGSDLFIQIRNKIVPIKVTKLSILDPKTKS